MSRHSLALSEQQTQLIRAITDTVQPNLRPAFLASLEDRLIGCSQVSDADLMNAINHAQASFEVNYDDCI